jgi:tetratricopeptide (TPR) repeat protein
MHRVLLVAAALLTILASRVDAARESSPAKSQNQEPAASDSDVQQTVLALIKQLGDEQYAVRRRAEEDLIRLGPDAFDQLKLAEESADLEVAERARYIVQRMRVDWARREDSAEVRRIFTRYGDLAEAERNKRVTRLAELKDGEGLPGLCRIARLEPSPQVARRAALAVLQEKLPTGGKPALAAPCLLELGASDRAPAIWIQLWLREQADRAATLADWNAALEAEAALLKEESPETSFDVVYALMKRRLEMCNELKLLDETTSALMRMTELFGADNNVKQMAANLTWAMRWIIDHQRWDVLKQVEEQRHDQIHGDRKLLYYLAAAKQRAGEADDAARLSDRAFAMPADDPEDRVVVGGSLAELGCIDWAEREYRRALDDLPVVSLESLEARRAWATWLHDREQNKKAADVLGEFFDAMANDAPARRKLIKQMDGRQYLNPISARREYYLACHYESRKDYERQREQLEKAWAHYADDPDILIAMYRSPGADDAFREQTRARIEEMSQRYLALIEQAPDETMFLNQWAWLVSNTEGDFAKAVEHSQHSLELSPEEPSFLDTLARCHYAAGDLESAVKTQRRAVELAPQYGVMKRQLAQFEKEFAAKGKK